MVNNVQLSRVEGGKRSRFKRLEKGLCKNCNKQISPRSKDLCEYHLGYNSGSSLVRNRLERFLVGNFKEDRSDNGKF